MCVFVYKCDSPVLVVASALAVTISIKKKVKNYKSKGEEGN